MNEIQKKSEVEGCTCGSEYHRSGNLLCEANHLPVFTYGTLRVGGALHGHVAPFVVAAVDAATVGRRVETGQWFPGVVFDGAGEAIAGQALHLQGGENFAKAMRKLDWVEGAPDLYTRVKVDLQDGTQAWAYSYNEKREAETDGSDQVFA